MAKKRESIPQSMAIAEASEFWHKHSVGDYPTLLMKMTQLREGQTTFVAVAKDMLRLLEKRARCRGVFVETLINLWIQEKLATLALVFGTARAVV